MFPERVGGKNFHFFVGTDTSFVFFFYNTPLFMREHRKLGKMQFFNVKARCLYCGDFASRINDTRVPVSCRAINEYDIRVFTSKKLKNKSFRNLSTIVNLRVKTGINLFGSVEVTLFLIPNVLCSPRLVNLGLNVWCSCNVSCHVESRIFRYSFPHTGMCLCYIIL